MIGADLFNHLVQLYQALLKHNKHMRIACVGDMNQLPVVNGELLTTTEYYTQCSVLYLTENNRQRDPDCPLAQLCNEFDQGDDKPSGSSLEYMMARLTTEVPAFEVCLHLLLSSVC